MVAVIVIAALTSLGIIVSVLLKPSIKIGKVSFSLYWVIALLGAILIVLCKLVSFSDVKDGLFADTAVNPIKILVLFISMTVLSIFLDEAGFFEYLATVTLKKAGASPKRLFVYLYVIVSVLTIFTSNDIIVLTFTPFICYFSKRAKINPIPFLFCEFVAANTWSMMLIIGNPTNIYLATMYDIGFIEYFKVMALPATIAGVTAFIMLLLVFKKQLALPMESLLLEDNKPINKLNVTVGLVHLGACIIILTIASYLNLEMWLISLICMCSLFVCILVIKLVKKEKPNDLFNCAKRTPWALIPFVISMFIIVLSLEKYEVTNKLASVFSHTNPVLTYGLGSTLFANIINNIPMSVLFANIISSVPAGSLISVVYATIIGSNLGALLTPVGALAGIMWMQLLKSYDVKLTFATFAKYGSLIMLPTLLASLGALQLALLWA